MELPDPVVIAGVITALAGLITAVFVGVKGLVELKNTHELAMEDKRSAQYLVDYEELEDLRSWRRLAIRAINKFLDDYSTRSIDPPVDAVTELIYPPKTRPRDTSKGRLES